MSRYQEEIVGQVKEATDIISLIGSYLPLRKAGKNYVALCPFHEEKSPSFSVSPERKSFKCFGCGKGGDVITFVEEYEKVDFPQALEILAERAGIAIRGKSQTGPEAEMGQMRKALDFAKKHFLQNYRSAGGRIARAYIESRGITPSTAEEFGLGFAAASWDSLKIEARKAGFSDGILERAGLIVRNDQGRLYDRFRNRLTVPIFDNLGRTLGFGARVFDDSKPKYINSPESPLFSKGRLLYGLEKAKNEAMDTGKIRIVEGYTDVILPYQAGVKNIVATLGTALTKDHAKLLRRYVHTVVLIFDGDEAGQKANDRGVEILLEEDFEVKVVMLPDEMDPGDLVQERGAEALKQALNQEIDFFEFSLTRLARRYDMGSISGKARAFDEIFVLLRKLRSPIKRDLMFPQIADRLGVGEKEVRKRFNELGSQSNQPSRSNLQVSLERESSKGRNRTRRIEEELLAVILKDPSIVPFVREKLRPEDLKSEGLAGVFQAMLRLYEETGTVSAARLMEQLAGNPCRASIAKWHEMEFEDPAKIAEQLLRALGQERREEQIARLKNEARLAKRSGDHAEVEVSYAEIDRILKEARTNGI